LVNTNKSNLTLIIKEGGRKKEEGASKKKIGKGFKA
jgi:hypothetical protein